MNEVSGVLIHPSGCVRRTVGKPGEQRHVHGEQIDVRHLDERVQTSSVRMVEEYELAHDVCGRGRDRQAGQRWRRQRCGWQRSA